MFVYSCFFGVVFIRRKVSKEGFIVVVRGFVGFVFIVVFFVIFLVLREVFFVGVFEVLSRIVWGSRAYLGEVLYSVGRRFIVRWFYLLYFSSLLLFS